MELTAELEKAIRNGRNLQKIVAEVERRYMLARKMKAGGATGSSNRAEFLGWCIRLGLTEMARAAVAMIRSCNPARRVGGGRRNVLGRYPSRKMGAIILFESHRAELPVVYELEHDSGVLEYYDQPSIPLTYYHANGRRLSVMHTPDYFVVRRDSAGWVEYKSSQDLENLAKQPESLCSCE